MKIIIRVDDFGFSEAVNLGVMKAYAGGLVRNIGLMSNMPYAKQAYELIKDKHDVMLGLHVNLILGKPCASGDESLNSLLDKSGYFISSKIRRQEMNQGIDGFNYQETRKEVKAQIAKFYEICGKLPDYIDAHAVCTPNSEKAISDAANEYGIDLQGHKDSVIWQTIQQDYTNEDFYCQKKPFVDFFKNHLEYGNKVNLVVFHPGYVDYDVISQSSLIINRCRDTALLCDQEVNQYLLKHATLLNFREAGEMYGR